MIDLNRDLELFARRLLEARRQNTPGACRTLRIGRPCALIDQHVRGPVLEDVFRTLQIVIILQSALFVSYLALSGRLRILANRFLCLCLVILSAHMGINLVHAGWNSLDLASLAIALGFCYGPLIYLYTRSLSLADNRAGAPDLLHALPPIIAFIMSSTVAVSIFLFAFGILASIAIYSFMTWRLISRFHRTLEQTRTDFEDLKLTWLKRLLAIQCTILVINSVSSGLGAAGHPQASQTVELFVFLGLAAMVNLFILHGLQYPRLFEGISTEDMELSAAPAPAVDTSLQDLMTQIDAHMNSSQAYLRPGLTVKALGRQLLTNPVLVSQAINACTDSNFSDYVNRWRVKNAMGMLASPEHDSESIFDIMLASGFNTKSNFNRAFKQETGITPFAYRKQAGKGTPDATYQV